jgi:hypothetical protein
MVYFDPPQGPQTDRVGRVPTEYIERCNEKIKSDCGLNKSIKNYWEALKDAIKTHTEDIDTTDEYAIMEYSTDRLLLNVLGIKYLIQLKFTTSNKAEVHYTKIDKDVIAKKSNGTTKKTITIHAYSINQDPIIKCDDFSNITKENLKMIHASFISDLIEITPLPS